MTAIAFNITGERLTDIVRTLWADDQQPEKAINILRSAFPEMVEGTMYLILCGSYKLVGDSHGMTLEDDDTTESKLGNPLSIEHTIKTIRDKYETKQDYFQLAIGETHAVGSVKGRIEIPKRRKKQWEKGEVGLEDIPYRQTMFGSWYRHSRFDSELESLESYPEPDPTEPEDPPPPEYKITTIDGWLSPDGKYYRCPLRGHTDMADRLGFQDIKLEKRGWVKISGGEVYYLDKINQRQRDMLFDWYSSREVELPEWMKKNGESHG